MFYNNTLQDMEVQLLLKTLYHCCGFDFRDYAPSYLKRRIWEVICAERLGTASNLQEKIVCDPACSERVVLALSVRRTAMFRSPAFFLAFRAKVLPLLRTYPFHRIWSVGCATGEEAYAMAILLEEEGLYRRCRIYATDMNEAVLQEAQDGIFPLSRVKQYAENYLKAGGKRSFSDYYTKDDDHVIIHSLLKPNIVFAPHNLATDASFNEFHVILCRNVTIAFNPSLQERVHHLLYESLVRLGVLCVGSKKSLISTSHKKDYVELAGREKIYRRIR